MRIRLFDLCRGGNFLTWDAIMEHDLSWKEMIYDISEQVLSFKLNATAMTLPSLSNLRRWGIKKVGKCPLCGKLNVTAAHVLSNCRVALRQRRYTWRHDNILAAIAKDVYGLVNRMNRHNATNSSPEHISFVKAGPHKKKPSELRSLLTKSKSTDWNVNIDFNRTLTIPPSTGVDTLLRPDIVFYSAVDKIIIWGELTVPMEQNMLDAHLRKTARYADLKAQLKLRGWTVYDRTWEIGNLGFISKKCDAFLRAIGFSNNQRKHIRTRVSKLALRSSYYIWMSRHVQEFLPPVLIAQPTPPIFRSYARAVRPKRRKTTPTFLSSLPPIPKPALPIPSPMGDMSDLSELSDGDVSDILRSLDITSPHERKHPLRTSPPHVQPRAAGWDSFDMDELLACEENVEVEDELHNTGLTPPVTPIETKHAQKHMANSSPDPYNDFEYDLAEELGAYGEF